MRLEEVTANYMRQVKTPLGEGTLAGTKSDSNGRTKALVRFDLEHLRSAEVNMLARHGERWGWFLFDVKDIELADRPCAGA